MKNTNKEFDAVAYAGKLRRENEIKEHGKQIWMRKCRVHDNPKAYNRNKEKHFNFDD